MKLCLGIRFPQGDEGGDELLRKDLDCAADGDDGDKGILDCDKGILDAARFSLPFRDNGGKGTLGGGNEDVLGCGNGRAALFMSTASDFDCTDGHASSQDPPRSISNEFKRRRR